MKKIIFLCIVFFGYQSYAQIHFEKGYFITNAGQKIDCLIKNIDWRSNPKEFQYKLSEEEDSKTKTAKTVKEFGIYDFSKYISELVDIDRSSESVSKLSDVREPVFKKEQLFLKVLIEGKASLYSYQDGNLTRFFYKTDAIEEVTQLIYKSYSEDRYKIGINTGYKGQLWKDLKCADIAVKEIQKIRYKKKELVAFFTKYNQCGGGKFTDFEIKPKREVFHINARLGFNSSSLRIRNLAFLSNKDVDFGSESGLRLGFEAEYVLPFNKNKWSLFVEPSYQSFTSEKELVSASSRISKVTVDYKSIDLSSGLRYYFFLTDSSKIFINASYVLNFDFGSKIEFTSSSDLDITSGSSWGFGLGYKYNNRYSLEFRYRPSRELLADFVFWISEYQTTSVIFGYTIF